MADSLIVNVIHRYDPSWEAPRDSGRTWRACKCPFHDDNSASASVSYELNAFNCHGCGTKGDAIKLIRDREDVSYSEAERIATQLALGCNTTLPSKSPRKSGRRVFNAERAEQAGGEPVRTGIRSRASRWA